MLSSFFWWHWSHEAELTVSPLILFTNMSAVASLPVHSQHSTLWWHWRDKSGVKHVCRGFPSSPLTTQHSMMTLTWQVRCHVMRINSDTDWHHDLFLTSTSVKCFYYEIVTVSMLLSHIRDVHVSMVVVQMSERYNPKQTTYVTVQLILGIQSNLPAWLESKNVAGRPHSPEAKLYNCYKEQHSADDTENTSLMWQTSVTWQVLVTLLPQGPRLNRYKHDTDSRITDWTWLLSQVMSAPSRELSNSVQHW